MLFSNSQPLGNNIQTDILGFWKQKPVSNILYCKSMYICLFWGGDAENWTRGFARVQHLLFYWAEPIDTVSVLW